MELVLRKIGESQFQDVQRRKRAKRAWKRREKRRKKAALAEGVQGNGPIIGPADCPEHPEAQVPSPPTEDWTPPEIETEGQTGPAAGNLETEGPAEAGDSERPRKSDISSQVSPSKLEVRTKKTDDEEDWRCVSSVEGSQRDAGENRENE
jgi:hypothetical protein